MLDKLKHKWKVGGLQLALILCTFAIGGSITGFIGKKIMNSLQIGQPVLWFIVYIILITLLWPMAVLLVSFPFGQFRFFSSYLKKMGRRFGLGGKPVGSRETEAGSELPAPNYRLKRIAVFASGAGSNARQIIDHFKGSNEVEIALILCNKAGAGVLEIAQKEQIPAVIIEKERFFRGDSYISALKEAKTDLIVLAGFLWKVPSPLIHAYPGKIINIHPALLPAYGGKGMYGHFVHEAVIANKEKESGITIHYVDEQYDHGQVIFQEKLTLTDNETPATLAGRIQELEHTHFPRIIAQLLKH
jgi:formyltetrahydrofolate-dependent phosphoribosylglycinamide formyltransferase